MGEIRSALDIALEKTADIQGDKSGAENRDLRNSGKKAAGDFLTSRKAEVLVKLLEGKDKDQAKNAIEGAVSIMLASLKLPSTELDLEKLAAIGNGLDTLLPKAGMNELFGQVAQIFGQYLAERDQLGKALEQQFLPRLRAKQQEIAKRYGQTIPMELHQDPEYMSALTKNQRALEQKYEAVIAEVRGRVREIAGIEE